MMTRRVALVAGVLLLAVLALSVRAEDAAQPAAPAPTEEKPAPFKELDTLLSKVVPLQIILDNKGYLDLNADQEKKITGLRDKLQAASIKLKTDDEFQAKVQKVLAACKPDTGAGRKGQGKGGRKAAAATPDPDAALQQAANLFNEWQQLVDMFNKKSGLDLKATRDQMGQILTTDQMTKLQDLLKPVTNVPPPAKGRGKGKRN